MGRFMSVTINGLWNLYRKTAYDVRYPKESLGVVLLRGGRAATIDGNPMYWGKIEFINGPYIPLQRFDVLIPVLPIRSMSLYFWTMRPDISGDTVAIFL